MVVIRDDIASDDPRFRQYAIADNRISELNYVQDTEQLLAHMQSGIDISPMFLEDEIKALLDSLTPVGADEWAEAAGRLPDGEKSPFQQMTFTLSDAQAEAVKRALTLAANAGEFGATGNENGNGNALARIAEAYCGR